ncbi:hypothetical protein L6452_42021 [Arctium lappa]|uniref:Uncharacterized protein n=1 Tax=Arctium lappa TaxID=4217 RepID=A0ACB8XGP3_ARCLA|nr:hypothetical protein L6452_42021 [Arctium lappa]
MLQIRLSNKATASESGVGAKLPSGETVTVACPDHLVLVELPVAKSLGSSSGVTLVKIVGHRSRRPLGEHTGLGLSDPSPASLNLSLDPRFSPSPLDLSPSLSLALARTR